MSCCGLCFERIAPEHLLRGGYALGASLAKERNSPVENDGKPVLEASQRGSGPIAAIARKREIVAIVPRSRYRNGRRVLSPAIRRTMVRAA